MNPKHSIRALLNATVRLRTILLSSFIALAVIAGLGILKRETILEHLRIYAVGESEVAAIKYGRELGPVSRVEISEVLAETNSVARHNLIIYGEKTLLHTGPALVLESNTAMKFMQHWGAMRFHADYSAMCHDPAFVVRFMMGDDVLLKTSLCLHCQNFTIPSVFGETLMGFSSRHPTGVAFADHMRTLFPHSDKWETAPTDGAKSPETKP